MCVIFFFFFAVLEFDLRAFTLDHSTSPFFVKGTHELFAQGWLRTPILPISASSVGTTTGVIHQRLAERV
jgi:hypothetical protein